MTIFAKYKYFYEIFYELKSEAYNLLSKDWGNAIGVTFILFCVSIAASLIPYAGDAIGTIIAGPLAFGTALSFKSFKRRKRRS